MKSSAVGDTMRRRFGPWFVALPFIATVGILLGGAALWLVITSVQTQDGSFTSEAWTTAFDSPRDTSAMRNTLLVSALTASVAALFGTPLMLAISTSGRRGRDLSVSAANAAANFGGASLAVAWIATLGTYGFARLAVQSLGWDLPVELSSVVGYVIVYSSFVIPLFVLLTLPAAGVLRPEFWEAVQTVGGGRASYWTRVGLPVLAPFIASGWVLCFTWSAGQFSAPYALVGETPKDSLITLRIGDLLFSAIGGTLRFQQAAVYSVLLVALSVVALAIYFLSTRRVLSWLAT